LAHYVNLLNTSTEDYVIDSKMMRILKGDEIILEVVSIQPKSYLSS